MEWSGLFKDIASTATQWVSPTKTQEKGTGRPRQDLAANKPPLSGVYEVTESLKEYLHHVAQHPETFTNFPNPRGADAFLLSEEQEAHAVLILKEVPELQRLRYELCPSRMREDTFWQIYFLLILNRTHRQKQQQPNEQQERQPPLFSIANAEEDPAAQLHHLLTDHYGSGDCLGEENDDGGSIDQLSIDQLEDYFEQWLLDEGPSIAGIAGGMDSGVDFGGVGVGTGGYGEDSIDPSLDNYFACE
ncbi:hypothetical protein QOT17_015895 [Balamuthia mandrillaris]